MKTLCHWRLGLGLVGLLALGSVPLCAQVSSGAPGAAQSPPPLLDHDEMAQLSHAREQVFAAHPDLKAENDKLKAMHDSTSSPTDAQRSAGFVEWKAFRKKMRAEMLAVDPTLEPIFARIDAASKKGVN